MEGRIGAWIGAAVPVDCHRARTTGFRAATMANILEWSRGAARSEPAAAPTMPAHRRRPRQTPDMRTTRFRLRFRLPAAPLHQRVLPFVRRVRRRERWFKRLIAAATCLAVAAILCASPRGRYALAAASSEARRVFERALGVPRPRSEVDAEWARFREQGIRDSARALEQVHRDADPAMQRLLKYAGMDPETGLLRWGNFNLTLLLPSSVFEADDEGRSYRFRPSLKSIWVRNITIKSGVLMLFLVPDRPELVEALEGTGGIPVLSSRQVTNSWGLRGPEPDTDAPLRVLVLGDSYMQGMFVGDDDTPPECLRRYLQGRVDGRVSVLNTGVLGYSPEQYYYSLTTFADRYRPNLVVVSIYSNDFGDIHDVAGKGLGDWDEGKYWLEKIAALCRRGSGRS